VLPASGFYSKKKKKIPQMRFAVIAAHAVCGHSIYPFFPTTAITRVLKVISDLRVHVDIAGLGEVR
jgi:hypothetical protein